MRVPARITLRHRPSGVTTVRGAVAPVGAENTERPNRTERERDRGISRRVYGFYSWHDGCVEEDNRGGRRGWILRRETFGRTRVSVSPVREFRDEASVENFEEVCDASVLWALFRVAGVWDSGRGAADSEGFWWTTTTGSKQ